ncbi:MULTISPECIES: thiamine phosphate synthase [Anaerostipes]|uniref:thiamine phosphate synthase n=1 Tax=Anaerostipes TaxID=207244 RepID=UPI0009527360|nr:MULTISPECIES: thiamine phosphate synthase [Anaerostipes]MCI5622607.1 thiamine phosphate synthase [Anaerostipes sp.]MDY2726998.1 thiamine phosphate synthase [Anaerostipes faecalis]OLR58698.1 thiamine-phosphate diphosphorylase [Anaerostipes sp. 494a]
MKVNSETMTLYAVTDAAWTGDQTLIEQVREALEGGISFLQLREKKLSEEDFLKEAVEIKKLADQYKVPFVINDNIEIARKVNADGVHVGQDDMPVEEVRKLLGENKIIGVSAHNVEEAMKAEEGGADYLGVGAVCATSTKSEATVVTMEEMSKICQSVSIPVVAIGGINKDTIMKLKGTGVDGVAVVSGIFGAKNIRKAAKELLEITKEMKLKEKNM